MNVLMLVIIFCVVCLCWFCSSGCGRVSGCCCLMLLSWLV